jgi:Tol biopolymer transport system component
MTSDDRFGGSVSVWLQQRAGTSAPDYLDDILGRTARTRQRPGWTSIERWPPMEIGATRMALPSRFQLRSIAMLAIIGLLLGVVVATIAFLGSRQRVPLPFGPAANGVILSEGAEGDIYVSAADGTDTRPLVTGAESDLGPRFTHDGTRFVFLRSTSEIDQRVMIANADGTGIRQLSEPLSYVSLDGLSPSDDRLAIVHRLDGQRTMSILDLKTGELDRLPVPGLNVDDNTLWRPPNGEELIFTARPEFNSSTGAGVYAIRPDGTGFREILPVRPEEWAYLDPRVAQDGTRLTYWMYEADDSADNWGAHVHIVDLATGNDERMVFDPANEDESELRFSPDGTTGAIVASDGTDAFVQLVDLAGSAQPRRVGPAFAGNEPKAYEFSPDGKQLIFVLDNDEPMYVDVATGQLTTGPTKWGMYSSWQRLAP